MAKPLFINQNRAQNQQLSKMQLNYFLKLMELRSD